MRDSVYVVKAELFGSLSQGSAVRIGPNTVVTNCHVIEGATSIALDLKGTRVPAELLHADAGRDLCTLTASQLPPGEVPAIRHLSTLRVGERVVALGAPRGLDLTLSEGIIAATRDTDIGTLVQTTAPISPGSSGGALFDLQARLVGITTFQRRDSQNLNFAAPAHWIAEVPTRHVPLSSGTPKQAKTVVKLVCRGTVRSSDPVAIALRSTNVWSDTVEVELDLAEPTAIIRGFYPALKAKRAASKGGWLAPEPKYPLLALADLLLHSDSENEMRSDGGVRMLAQEVRINRKTGEMILTDTEQVMFSRNESHSVTRGEYECRQDAGRKF